MKNSEEIQEELTTVVQATIAQAEVQQIDLVGIVLIARNGDTLASYMGKRIPQVAWNAALQELMEDDDPWTDQETGQEIPVERA